MVGNKVPFIDNKTKITIELTHEIGPIDYEATNKPDDVLDLRFDLSLVVGSMFRLRVTNFVTIVRRQNHPENYVSITIYLVLVGLVMIIIRNKNCWVSGLIWRRTIFLVPFVLPHLDFYGNLVNVVIVNVGLVKLVSLTPEISIISMGHRIRKSTTNYYNWAQNETNDGLKTFACYGSEFRFSHNSDG